MQNEVGVCKKKLIRMLNKLKLKETAKLALRIVVRCREFGRIGLRRRIQINRAWAMDFTPQVLLARLSSIPLLRDSLTLSSQAQWLRLSQSCVGWLLRVLMGK